MQLNITKGSQENTTFVTKHLMTKNHRKIPIRAPVYDAICVILKKQKGTWQNASEGTVENHSWTEGPACYITE